MKIAIWWNIPCKSIVPVARELAEIDSNKVTFISQSNLSKSRKDLGWELPNFGKANYVVLPDNIWEESVKELIQEDFDIHIFNGVYLFPKIRYALDFARKKNIPFGVISEAYHNPYNGYKHILKTIFTRTITPFRVFPRVKNAKFILSASGNNIKPFLHLGWKKKQFFPFGYFPENSGITLKNKKINKIPQLLCTGYITKNKGQYLMLQALSELKKKKIAFKCKITGFGPEEENVKRLSSELNLNKELEFTGVISDMELNEIKSNTDILVAPGIEEPWGIRINEALLAHTPVVVSNKIGASELIKASGAGEVFESGNVDSLIQALIKQLDIVTISSSKKKAKEFSKFITPKCAAQYLHDVVQYTLYDKGEKPYPIWFLQKNDI